MTSGDTTQAGALTADTGIRGVLFNVGHMEEDPGRAAYLVRFEGEGLVLGAPTGCWTEELRVEGADGRRRPALRPGGPAVGRRSMLSRIPSRIDWAECLLLVR